MKKNHSNSKKAVSFAKILTNLYTPDRELGHDSYQMCVTIKIFEMVCKLGQNFPSVILLVHQFKRGQSTMSNGAFQYK